MVTAFGMSDKLGRVRYQANEQEVFLGHSVTQTQNVSEATAQIIDQEVRRLIEEAEGRARAILTERLDELHMIAKALLEYETLSSDEIGQVLRGEKVVRDDTGGASGPGTAPARLGADQQRRSGAGRQSRAAAGHLTAAYAGIPLDRPRLMAIVNVTPDSFSDGGERLDPAQAIDDGLRFVSEGADIVDVGGEFDAAGLAADVAGRGIAAHPAGGRGPGPAERRGLDRHAAGRRSRVPRSMPARGS